MALSIQRTDLPRMSIDEFLAWDSGDDLRYELVNGWVVAQSAPSKNHGQVDINLGTAIKNRLRAADRPCMPESGSVLRIDKRWTVRAPDILVRCGPNRRSVDTPILAVEILSPSNSAGEMARKRDDYASAGILQVLEVEQASAEAWLYRREGDRWVAETILGLDAVIELESIGISVSMSEIYEDVELVPQRGVRPPTAS